MSRRELFPHQTYALNCLRRSIGDNRKKRPVLSGPCGFGKSFLCATMIRGAIIKGNRVVITVTHKNLVGQAIEMLRSEGITCFGVMAGGYKTNPSMPVQIATVQALARRKWPEAQLVLVDEAHITYRVIYQMMAHPMYADAIFVGLTATPGAKGMGAAGRWDDLIIASTAQELIDTINPATCKPFLVPFKAYAPKSGIKPDLSGVPVEMGEYNEAELEKRVRVPKLVADVVDTWLDPNPVGRPKARGRPTAVFAASVAHGEDLLERFCAKGVFAELITGETEVEEREAIKERLLSGETEVVISIETMIVGCDWTFIGCISFARPTKSEMLWVQAIGRGMRPHPGKDFLLILDHSTNTERLGLITEIEFNELDDGAKKAKKPAKRKEALPKECPSCNYLKPAKTPVCPNCGFQAKPQSKVVTTVGELTEVKASKVKATMAEKQSMYSAFRWFALSMGKDPNWAYYLFKDWSGKFPSNKLSKEPEQPTIEQLEVIKGVVGPGVWAAWTAKQRKKNG